MRTLVTVFLRIHSSLLQNYFDIQFNKLNSSLLWRNYCSLNIAYSIYFFKLIINTIDCSFHSKEWNTKSLLFTSKNIFWVRFWEHIQYPLFDHFDLNDIIFFIEKTREFTQIQASDFVYDVFYMKKFKAKFIYIEKLSLKMILNSSSKKSPIRHRWIWNDRSAKLAKQLQERINVK